MRIPKIWLAPEAVASIETEAAREPTLETGGVLVGWRDVNHAYVVEVAIGPGPLASHEAGNFRPDSRWQVEQLTRLYGESGRTLVYLGDWHTHPSSRPSMSRLDRKTLRSIARFKPARLLHPVMLIRGLQSEQVVIGGWVQRGWRVVTADVRMWNRH